MTKTMEVSQKTIRTPLEKIRKVLEAHLERDSQAGSKRQHSDCRSKPREGPKTERAWSIWKSRQEVTLREKYMGKKKKQNILTEEQLLKKQEMEERRKAHVRRVADEMMRNVVGKVLNENPSKRERVPEKERKVQARGRAIQPFGENEVTIQYKITSEGKFLKMPNYDYISFLIPSFLATRTAHAHKHQQHHQPHQPQAASEDTHHFALCSRKSCNKEGIYRIKNSELKACSVHCYKLLAHQPAVHVH